MLTGGIARLDVGPSHEPFDVHVELLCEQSVFFNEKYSNRYEESTIETLVLDDVNPDDFADVVSWMYQGTLKGIYPQPCVPSWLRLCTIWILAQRFGMPKLQDEALDWLKSKGDVDVVIELEAVLLIYHETALGSSLRRFAVENWVTKSTSMDEFQASKHLFPHDFLVDICTILFKAMGEQSAGKGYVVSHGRRQRNYHITDQFQKLAHTPA